MERVASRDGTLIAYDRIGEGPAVILVTGALSDRSGAVTLAPRLAGRFTVVAYDRRGRGDSGDTPPYAVDREIEDLEAVIGQAGGSACVFGHSSGAALALEAAVRGLPITKLALYEPPYIVDDSRAPLPDEYVPTLQALVAEGRRGDAVEYFWRVGLLMPPEASAHMRNSPMWPAIEARAASLPYDAEVMGDHMAGNALPARWAAQVAIPTLVIDGGMSPAQLRNAAAAVASLLPNARRVTLQDQGHGAPPEVLAPVLASFFQGG
jgi:pimeloyl-ACP methyl ester carboxylesterase